MIRFILQRFIQSVLLIYIVATLVFLLVRITPGGPFSQDRNLRPEQIVQLEEQYGLSETGFHQYYKFIYSLSPKQLNPVGLIQWDIEKAFGVDLGYSMRYEGRRVNQLLQDSLPTSFELGLYALLLAMVVGVISGVAASVYPDQWPDRALSIFYTLGICIPALALAPILIGFFGFMLPSSLQLPVMHWDSPSHKVLPVLALSFYYLGSLGRLTRAYMLEVSSAPYLKAARAKGLGTWKIAFKHGLLSTLSPIIAYIGPTAAHLLTGSFVVEAIFNIPGMGMHLVNSALNRDYSLLIGCVLVYTVLIVVLNTIADIIAYYLNPQSRES